mgnify:FL=1
MYNKVVRTVPVRIASNELERLLAARGPLAQWKAGPGGRSIVRECRCANFEQTWGFLTGVAMRSHIWGHHPTITTTYTSVKLELSTHDIDSGSVSDIDIKLAKRIEQGIGQYKDAD